ARAVYATALDHGHETHLGRRPRPAGVSGMGRTGRPNAARVTERTRGGAATSVVVERQSMSLVRHAEVRVPGDAIEDGPVDARTCAERDGVRLVVEGHARPEGTADR